MKRIILLFLLLTVVCATFAQELKVKSMAVAEGDLTASINQRLDLNENPCALLRVMLKDSSPKFEGNVLGTVEQKGMTYMVYLSAGTKLLRIVPADSYPIMITFADYGINALESKVTYDLSLYEVDLQ